MPGSTPSQEPSPLDRTDSPDHPFDRASDPFFLSPTWTWPVFEPECCQECGRVIPMHETGWILRDLLDESIVCAECFQILDDLRTQRQVIMDSTAQPVAAPPLAASHAVPVEDSPPPSLAPPRAAPREISLPMLAVSHTPTSPGIPEITEIIPSIEEFPTESPPQTHIPAEPRFELTPPPAFVPRPFFEDVGPTGEPSARGEPIDAPTLFDIVTSDRTESDAVALIATESPEPPIAATEPAPAEPVFELTPPPAYEPRSCFASIPLVEASAAPEPVIGDSPLLFDSLAGAAPEPTENLADEPPFVTAAAAPTEPAFELTAPPAYEPRACFASIALDESTTPEPAIDDSPLLFDGVESDVQETLESPIGEAPPVDAQPMPREPAFELTPPPAFTPRRCFASIALEPDLPLGGASDDSIPLFDAIEIDTTSTAPPIEPRFELTEPPAYEPRPRFALVPISEPDPVAPAGDDAPTLFTAKTNENEPPAPAAEPPQPQPELPRTKARARKPRLPALPPAPPLSFIHPVDALLNKLHHEHVDTQVWNALNRWRSLDPLHREVEAMLAIATELRDRWMVRRDDPAQARRSSAG